MILNCPSCGARFKVDAALLGEAGRNVRCGSCGHNWHQTARDAASAEARSTSDIRPDPSLDKLDEQRKRVQARRAIAKREIASRSSSGVGWLIFLAVLVALVAGAWLGREAIIAALPGTVALYEMVGLEETVGEGLDLRDVISERRTVDGVPQLLVEGTIVNVSERPRPVPMLRASLVDADGVELSTWTFAADTQSLPPGGFTTFKTEATNPPPSGSLTLVFIETK